MKDIKSLYLTAKSSGKSTDISAYSEAVHELLEANPNEYITNLEYIISSNIGLETLNEFVEKYGIPISYYDTLTNMLESCIHKAELFGKDASLYKEELEMFESFRKKYIGCFMMESYFHDKLPDNYISAYYGFNKSGIQNRKLLSGMIEKFGEAAIPDLIITSDNIGGSSLNTLIRYIESHDTLGTPGTCEWLLEATKNLLPENDAGLLLLESSSLSKIIKDMKDRNLNLYRESIIMGKDEVKFEYTESEVCSLQDLIEITEYKLTWGDELNESAEDIHKNIISLYEEVDGLLNDAGDPETFDEDVADSVVPMLPNEQTKPVEESKWLVNTRNKKTGDAPGYLKKNHNLGYGEDDDLGVKDNEPKSNSSEEIKLDDFKRPSEEDISDTSTSYSGFDDKEDDNGTKEMTPAEKQAAINNYYYYTYTNSLNRNTTGSYNHDNNNKHTTTTGSYNHDNDNKHTTTTTGSYNHDNDNSRHQKDDENLKEAVGDADDSKPESDHPIKDILTDVDRELGKKQQEVKKKVQNVQNVGKAFMKPVKRTQQWVTNMVYNWKDADENNIKEKMADPHARSNLLSAIKTAIAGGSLLKAGLLLNPVFLFLTVTRGVGRNKKAFRIRNEMIGELKTELEVIEEKIKDADRVGDNNAKYKLMRLKNEINKKLLRVGGHKSWKKMI